MPAGLEERADRGIETRRVLHEDEAHEPSVNGQLLESTERRTERGDRARRGHEAHIERARGRERGERVVGVIEAGDWDADGIECGGHRDAEFDLARRWLKTDRLRAHVARRTREAALTAGPIALMREDDTLVAQRRLAAGAARRVADRLRDLPTDGRIVDAEVRDGTPM